jgi:methylenetetrahydrofolate reductase (NADPH)
MTKNNDMLYHIEVNPPRLIMKDFEKELNIFAEKFNKVIDNGHYVSITDNAMGTLSFQGIELIEELELNIQSDKVILHITTFHTKDELDKTLNKCKLFGVKKLLILSGDGSERLHRLEPEEIGAEGEVKSVTSVELLKYIKENYPGDFILGAAFNPYEPPEHEFSKLDKKLAAGASFIITQPILGQNDVIDELLEKYHGLDVIVAVWMSKKLDVLSKAIGYDIQYNEEYDAIKTLQYVESICPKCGIYLSLLNFKTQFEFVNHNEA